MPVLPYQADGAIVESGQNYSAARMMDHFANVCPVSLANGVDGDVENASGEYFPGVDELRSL
jgi:hypothetical protein